jgi:hypothetical protein
MSFGTSVGDFILIIQLERSSFQGARKACGEYDELRLRAYIEFSNESRKRSLDLRPVPEMVKRRKELDEAVAGCENILRVMDEVLRKYNALGDDKKKGNRLWQKSNSATARRRICRTFAKLSTHATAIMMSLMLYTLGSLGRMKEKLSNQGGDLEGIRESLNWIAANMTAGRSAAAQGSAGTTYEMMTRLFGGNFGVNFVGRCTK